MKSILISIRPKWCELIASGKKTIEVRKTAPKFDKPFKAYIYETKEKKYDGIGVHWENGRDFIHNGGKVIGEFICNMIEKFVVGSLACDDVEQKACISYREICDYFYGKNYDNTVRIGYGWHISDLKIYDKPKELSEFEKYYECGNNSCGNCNKCDKDYHLTRPPQSWCYVEWEAVKALENMRKAVRSDG